jgi:hypothetical protein
MCSVDSVVVVFCLFVFLVIGLCEGDSGKTRGAIMF